MQHRQGWRQEFLTRCRTVSVIRNYSLQLTRTDFFWLFSCWNCHLLKRGPVCDTQCVGLETPEHPCLGDWRDSPLVQNCFLSGRCTGITGDVASGTTLQEKVVTTEGNLPHKPTGVVAGTSSPTWLGGTICGISKEQKVFPHHLLINGSYAQTLDTSLGHPWCDHLSDTGETAR